MKLSKEHINSLYRGLYTYSHGFFKTLYQLFSRVADKNNRSLMMANAWQVFSILLEHCCKHDIKMMINRNQFLIDIKIQAQERLIKTQDEEIKRLIKELSDVKHQNEHERKLSESLYFDLEKQFEKITERYNLESKKRKEEIDLRMQLMTKVNELFKHCQMNK